jgi:hypothetical protein
MLKTLDDLFKWYVVDLAIRALNRDPKFLIEVYKLNNEKHGKQYADKEYKELIQKINQKNR